MKTTLDIDGELFRMAKACAAHERTSLTALVEQGLRLRLRDRRFRGLRQSRPLPVYLGKSGLAKNIDPTTLR